MNIWHQFPLVRVYIAIITGTSMALISGSQSPPGLLWPALLFMAVLLSSVYFRSTAFYRFRWVFGLLLNLFFIVLGYDLVAIHNGNLREDNFARMPGKHYLLAVVDEPPLERERVYKTILSIKSIRLKDGYAQASGRILAYFSKDSLSSKLRYGDLLIFGAGPRPVDPPGNPGAFNYRKYLAANYVYHQVFLRTGAWKKLSSGQGSTIKALAAGVRDKFLTLFRANGIAGKEYMVASALILGSSDRLDAETRREYSGSGAMHILSVSGMHVAVIFAVLNLMLGFMNKRNSLKIIKTIILVSAIWFYAAITGLSPAVLRAAWMITFVIIGLTWMRYANVYNVLAASALLITLADPLIITNVGFQLSYMAVLGIVSLEPMIYRLWKPRRRIVDWVWKLTAVSLAAQLATFPIACYYFHQFANYFLITNLVAIPLAALVIYAGMAVLITSPVHFISALLAKLMIWFLMAMNSTIRWIEGAPGAVSRDIPFSLSMMVLIYLLIIILFTLWMNQRKIYVFLALITVLLIAGLNVADALRWQQQKEFVVYSVKKQTSFCFISGREAVLFADSAVTADSLLISYTMHSHWVSKALKKVDMVSLGDMRVDTSWLQGECLQAGNYYQFGNKRVALISQKPPKLHSGAKLTVDFLVISNMPGVRMAQVCDLYDAGQVIIDSSVPAWKARLWKQECDRLGQKCYSVNTGGAFLAELF